MNGTGGGFILRDANGRPLLAEAFPTNGFNALHAEALALRQTMEVMIEIGEENVVFCHGSPVLQQRMAPGAQIPSGRVGQKEIDFLNLICHPLSDPFIRYLLGQPDPQSSADHPPRFLLPRPASGHDPLPRTTARIDPTSSLSPLNSDSDSDDDRQSPADAAPSFPDLEDAVNRSITALGGAVLPKLNWSSPKDAAWISSDGSLRCTSFSDIALLLRSSDSISHDLSQALTLCSDASLDPPSTAFYLALRKCVPLLSAPRWSSASSSAAAD
ncbi:hypothetical protein J5N97_017131 [Dioscorea zingiberensis]|uniref:Uncharacterized protein n=1 Tax=Dioscorea zingiberensis TaxID=325984 RepID=A0A9D5HFU8_9LILI|nr:hypothetical protein J5N97_017131 [Dioscorea zingiberensis]